MISRVRRSKWMREGEHAFRILGDVKVLDAHSEGFRKALTKSIGALDSNSVSYFGTTRLNACRLTTR